LYTIIIIVLAIIALQAQSFYLFCLSTFLFGITMATMYQFRFAAIESVNQSRQTGIRRQRLPDNATNKNDKNT
jgi:hypothetical protein